MSAASAARVADPRVSPRRRPAPQTAPAPRLRVVRAPALTRTRVPFVLFCMAVLGVALLSALLLNTTMAHGAYEKFDLSNELARLTQDEMDMASTLDRKASPEQLARAARDLGMVPAQGTGWLRLSDGSVRGTPEPAGSRR